MTQEEKDLLLKYLSAALPYGVRIKAYGDSTSVLTGEHYDLLCTLDNIESLPFLRPMSSMTEEEENKYNSLNAYEGGIFPHTEEAFDWLNAHHFDYRGLIDKGLALEASEGMYN